MQSNDCTYFLFWFKHQKHRTRRISLVPTHHFSQRYLYFCLTAPKGKQNKSGICATYKRDIKLNSDRCLFFVRQNRQEGGSKKNDSRKTTKACDYDMDGCFCLLIAIVNGVGASTARRLYDKGPEAVRDISPLAKGRPPDQEETAGKTERNGRMRTLRKRGYSLEAISDILNCDSSTVKRNLKKKG